MTAGGAVITQLSQRYTLFTAEGTPERATVQVTLLEVPREAARNASGGQNPTSSGTPWVSVLAVRRAPEGALAPGRLESQAMASCDSGARVVWGGATPPTNETG